DLLGELPGEAGRAFGQLLDGAGRLGLDLAAPPRDLFGRAGASLVEPLLEDRHALRAQILTGLERIAPSRRQLLLALSDGALEALDALGVRALGLALLSLARLEDRGERRKEVALQDPVADPEGKDRVETGDVGQSD